MASHQDFVDYVAEQLRDAGTICGRKMFGEYGLFCDDVFFAVICDDQFFVKITPAGEAAFPDLPKVPPYDDEPATVAAMEEYARGQGYELDFREERFHHEIYLSDVRRCKPEKLKTVIRQPIKRAE